jgi:hypothetical protein
MPLPRPSSPRVLWQDLRAFARERPKHQWIAATAAVVMPLIILFGFYKDAQTNIAPGEQIVFAESWTGTRSDEEIKAAQAEREKRREAAQAERQRQFKELEKKFGMK